MSESAQNRESSGEVVVYEAPDGGARVEVVVGDDSVWLTQAQMAELLGRERSVITRHVGAVFLEGELDRESNVQNLHIASGGDRPTAFYSLDVVISVGYRVKSRRGTQFRRWATGVLRDHLLRGYTVNEQRLLARGVEFDQAVTLLSATLRQHEALTPEGQAVLDVVQHYARTWRMLRDDISARGEPAGLFGQERGDALESVLLNIEQTWDSVPLYPTVESRAAHLIYFVVKDHPLVDGNKRTGALLFLEFLRRNVALLGADGHPRFSDTALVALTLLVAESAPAHKDLVIRLVLNLLAEDRP